MTIERFDMQKSESNIRLIEMLVDSCVSEINFPTPGYAMQFWQDMRLYGLKEAIAYLDAAAERYGIRSDGYSSACSKLMAVQLDLEKRIK